MPRGTPRSPLVRSIDERLGLAQQEIRKLELARAALQQPKPRRRPGRPRKPTRLASARISLAELDAHFETRRRPLIAA